MVLLAGLWLRGLAIKVMDSWVAVGQIRSHPFHVHLHGVS